MIIDTHTHGDHVGGQVEFPATVDIVAQEQSNINMRETGPPWDARMAIYGQGNNSRMLPKRTGRG
jgi:glyoxylase-like metal-dependent hydrolase (beta-lactamase superfamily II)